MADPGPRAARGPEGSPEPGAGQGSSREHAVPGAAAHGQPISPAAGDQHDQLLVAALEHAWNWWEFRIGNGLQVLSFFLVAASILVGAYVTALSARLDPVAAAIAAFGAAASAVAYVVGRRQNQVAALAVQPLRDLQARLARQLEIDSLRMVDRYQDVRRSSFPGPRAAAQVLFPVAAAASVAAAIYAALRH